MSEKTFIEKFELCFRSVEDNVNMALAIVRAAKFNRDVQGEHHREVVLARLEEVRRFGMNWAMIMDSKAASRIEARSDETPKSGSARKGESRKRRPNDTGRIL